MKKMLLDEWMLNILESGRCSGVKWEDEEEKIFRITWINMKNNAWNKVNSQVFFEYATFKGRYKSGDEMNFPKWKQSLKSALDKNPHIKRVDVPTSKHYRLYKFKKNLSTNEPHASGGSKKYKKANSKEAYGDTSAGASSVLKERETRTDKGHSAGSNEEFRTGSKVKMGNLPVLSPLCLDDNSDQASCTTSDCHSSAISSAIRQESSVPNVTNFPNIPSVEISSVLSDNLDVSCIDSILHEESSSHWLTNAASAADETTNINFLIQKSTSGTGAHFPDRSYQEDWMTSQNSASRTSLHSGNLHGNQAEGNTLHADGCGYGNTSSQGESSDYAKNSASRTTARICSILQDNLSMISFASDNVPTRRKHQLASADLLGEISTQNSQDSSIEMGTFYPANHHTGVETNYPANHHTGVETNYPANHHTGVETNYPANHHTGVETNYPANHHTGVETNYPANHHTGVETNYPANHHTGVETNYPANHHTGVETNYPANHHTGVETNYPANHHTGVETNYPANHHTGVETNYPANHHTGVETNYPANHHTGMETNYPANHHTGVETNYPANHHTGVETNYQYNHSTGMETNYPDYHNRKVEASYLDNHNGETWLHAQGGCHSDLSQDDGNGQRTDNTPGLADSENNNLPGLKECVQNCVYFPPGPTEKAQPVSQGDFNVSLLHCDFMADEGSSDVTSINSDYIKNKNILLSQRSTSSIEKHYVPNSGSGNLPNIDFSSSHTSNDSNGFSGYTSDSMAEFINNTEGNSLVKENQSFNRVQIQNSWYKPSYGTSLSQSFQSLNLSSVEQVQDALQWHTTSFNKSTEESTPAFSVAEHNGNVNFSETASTISTISTNNTKGNDDNTEKDSEQIGEISLMFHDERQETVAFSETHKSGLTNAFLTGLNSLDLPSSMSTESNSSSMDTSENMVLLSGKSVQANKMSTVQSSDTAAGIADPKALMRVEVIYGKPDQNVKTEYISSVHVRIFFGCPKKESVQKRIKSLKEFIPLELPPPKVKDFNMAKDDSVGDILKRLETDLGILIIYRNGDIYVVRRCTPCVFLSDGVATSNKLPRSTKEDIEVKAFDFNDCFQHSLREYIHYRRPPPKDHFVLTFGYEIVPNDINPTRSVPLYIKVQHLEALSLRNKELGPAADPSPKYSKSLSL